MNTEITFPHTYESGITVLNRTSRGAYMITDGLMVAFVIENYIRPDGTLTACGQKALLNSTFTYEQYLEQGRQWKERVEREKREREEAWKKAKEEGAKKVTYVLEKGVLLSGSSKSYKYACGKGFDLYHHICTNWNRIPKSQCTVERKNNKVYVTLPKWLAEKHTYIFKTIEA
jgi:hypothetical protein